MPKLEGDEAQELVSNGITRGMLQRWRLGEHGHILMMAGSQGSPLCIDIDGKNRSDGARVHLWMAHMPNPDFPLATQQVRRPPVHRPRKLTGPSICADVGALRPGPLGVEDAWEGAANPGRGGGGLGGRDLETY